IKRTPSAKEDLLAALADPSRKAIFNSLLEGSKAVKVIAADLPISQPAVSQHLKIMKNVGLLLEHRQGRSHFYSLNPLVLDWLSMHFGLLRDSALGSIGMSQTTNMDNCEFDSVDRAVHAWSRL